MFGVCCSISDSDGVDGKVVTDDLHHQPVAQQFESLKQTRFDDGTHLADDLHHQTVAQLFESLEKTRVEHGTRLAALESKLEQQGKMLQQLLESGQIISVGSVETPPQPEQPHRTAIHERTSIDYTKTAELVCGGRCYKVAESTWDGLLLAWSSCLGWGGSLIMTLATVVNTFMQLLLSVVALTDMAPRGNFANKNAIEDAREWRVSHAHRDDYMDKSNWISLNRLVCDLDGSLIYGNMQVSRLHEIESYTKSLDFFGVELPVGQTLALVCLGIFSLLIADELLNCILLLEALLTIPRIYSRTSFEADSGELRLVSISVWRLLFMLGTVILRLVIAAILLYAGGRWLANTSTIIDLLLNCAALAFVLELDELFYKSLTPAFLKEVVSRLHPVPLQEERMIRGLGWRPVAVIVVCVSYVLWMGLQHVAPMAERMLAVRSVMCSHGPQDFVVGVQPVMGFATIAVTNTTDEMQSRSTLRKHVTEHFAFGSNPYGHNWSSREKLIEFSINSAKFGSSHPTIRNASAWVEQEPMFKQVMKLAEFPDRMCNNMLDWYGSEDETLRLPVQYATGRFDAWSCTSFTDFCTDLTEVGYLVRLYCSQACQCNTNNFMPIFREGCLPGCLDRARAEQTYPQHDTAGPHFADCKDHNDAAFFKSSAMFDYFSAFEKMMGLNGLVPREDFRVHGCAALQFITINNSLPEWSRHLIVDQLCGRVAGTNLVIPDVGFTTLRAHCPVTCGCTIDPGRDCPSSCRRGVNSVAMDPCKSGLCPNVALLNATHGVGSRTCDSIDEGFHNSSYRQTCEIQQTIYRQACCEGVASELLR